MDQSEVISNIVNMIFDNFEKVFGSTQKVKMLLQSQDPAPKIKITQNKTVIEADVSLHIKNPYNIEYDASVVKSKLEIDLVFEVQENFNLTGKVKNITFTVQDMQNYFETETTLEEVQERISLFVQPI